MPRFSRCYRKIQIKLLRRLRMKKRNSRWMRDLKFQRLLFGPSHLISVSHNFSYKFLTWSTSIPTFLRELMLFANVSSSASMTKTKRNLRNRRSSKGSKSPWLNKNGNDLKKSTTVEKPNKSKKHCCSPKNSMSLFIQRWLHGKWRNKRKNRSKLLCWRTQPNWRTRMIHSPYQW